MVTVGCSIAQRCFQLKRHVAESAQFGRQQHHLLLDEEPARGALHAQPDFLPLTQRVPLPVHGAIQPRQSRLFVVAQSAPAVADGLKHAYGLQRAAQALVRIGEVAAFGGVRRQEFIQAR